MCDLYKMPKEISKSIPKPKMNETPLEYTSRISIWYSKLNQERIKGQIFTPTKLAKYMVTSIPPNLTLKRVLDPGVGTASLSCALIERIASFRKKFPLLIHAVEIDSDVSKVANHVLNHAKKWAKRNGMIVDYELFNEDFVDFGLSRIGLQVLEEEENNAYDLVIMNPPYYKLNSNDSAISKSQKIIEKSSNMYTLFISLATRLIRTGGYIVSVNPRSFLSGKYFENFRRSFFTRVNPYRIHRFISREAVFSEANVLQEIVIIAGVINGKSPNTVSILSSNGTSDIDHRSSITTKLKTILSESSDRRLALPLEERDLLILEKIQRWESSLRELGIHISTGPVVPFRSNNLLRNTMGKKTVPLLWMQNVKPLSIDWPLDFDKPQYIRHNNGLKPLVVNGEYIILRRFISKDSRSRLIAALMPKELLQYKFIGIENHLNILHNKWQDIDSTFALGLCSFLNSDYLSRIFHLINGTTQVNAYDLRLLPFPKRETIVEIGRLMNSETKSQYSAKVIDKIVNKCLINHNESHVR